MRKAYHIIATLTVLLWLTPELNAQIFIDSLDINQDTYVDSDNPLTNYGPSNELNVGHSNSGGYNQRFYLSFDFGNPDRKEQRVGV